MMTQPNDLQIVRGNFFNRDDLPRLTLVNDMLSFNNKCVELLDAEYVNIIVSEENKTIQIRKSRKYDFDSVKWFNVRKGKKRARKIRSPIFTAKFFNDLGFDYDHKYRLNGELRKDEVEELIFYADNPQTFVFDKTSGKYVARYPENWADSFGIPVSEHSDHKFHTFEDYVVLDITLEKVSKSTGEEQDEKTAARMNELTEKYVKDGGYL